VSWRSFEALRLSEDGGSHTFDLVIQLTKATSPIVSLSTAGQSLERPSYDSFEDCLAVVDKREEITNTWALYGRLPIGEGSYVAALLFHNAAISARFQAEDGPRQHLQITQCIVQNTFPDI
jgi:hypothetical protein